MPLLFGKDKHVVAANIRELRNSGHSEPQAIAVALKTARKPKPMRPPVVPVVPMMKPFDALGNPNKDYRGEKLVGGRKVRV